MRKKEEQRKRRRSEITKGIRRCEEAEERGDEFGGEENDNKMEPRLTGRPYSFILFINGSTALCWALASSSVS
jgi:hypothetical protein